LNQRPPGYEPDELPGCSTPQSIRAYYTRKRRLVKGHLVFNSVRESPEMIGRSWQPSFFGCFPALPSARSMIPSRHSESANTLNLIGITAPSPPPRRDQDSAFGRRQRGKPTGAEGCLTPIGKERKCDQAPAGRGRRARRRRGRSPIPPRGKVCRKSVSNDRPSPGKAPSVTKKKSFSAFG
jgi:hypothetical protein